MKKLVFILLLVIAFSGSLFANSTTEGKKVLITYYSFRNGNTYNVAKEIHNKVGGDIFKIETTTTYPKEYRGVTDQAKEEQNKNARPALVKNVDNIAQYDVIFVGFPNWWGTMPMVLFTFLETNANDLKGKTIIPFCTHGGSALGRSERDMKAVLTDSNILDGLAVSGSRSDNCKSDVEKWLKKIGITK